MTGSSLQAEDMANNLFLKMEYTFTKPLRKLQKWAEFSMTEVTMKDPTKLNCDHELEKPGKCVTILPNFPRIADFGDAPGFMLGAAAVPLRFRGLLGGVGDRRK